MKGLKEIARSYGARSNVVWQSSLWMKEITGIAISLTVLVVRRLPNPPLRASMSFIDRSRAVWFASQFWDTQTP